MNSSISSRLAVAARAVAISCRSWTSAFRSSTSARRCATCSCAARSSCVRRSTVGSCFTAKVALLPGVRYSVFGVRCSVVGVGPKTEHRRPNTEHRPSHFAGDDDRFGDLAHGAAHVHALLLDAAIGLMLLQALLVHQD